MVRLKVISNHQVYWKADFKPSVRSSARQLEVVRCISQETVSACSRAASANRNLKCIKKKHITQWHRSQPKQLKKPNTACIITGATAYLPPRGYNPQNALSKCTGCATCGDRLKAPRQRRCTKIDCFPHRASSALGKSGRSPYTTAPPQSCRAAVSATSSKRPTESAKMPSGNTSGTYRKATDIL